MCIQLYHIPTFGLRGFDPKTLISYAPNHHGRWAIGADLNFVKERLEFKFNREFNSQDKLFLGVL